MASKDQIQLILYPTLVVIVLAISVYGFFHRDQIITEIRQMTKKERTIQNDLPPIPEPLSGPSLTQTPEPVNPQLPDLDPNLELEQEDMKPYLPNQTGKTKLTESEPALLPPNKGSTKQDVATLPKVTMPEPSKIAPPKPTEAMINPKEPMKESLGKEPPPTATVIPMNPEPSPPPPSVSRKKQPRQKLKPSRVASRKQTPTKVSRNPYATTDPQLIDRIKKLETQMGISLKRDQKMGELESRIEKIEKKLGL
jgi:hypothetical protein